MATVTGIKEELKDSLYVMHSTKNQMVNHIPLKLFGFDNNVFCITTTHEDNKKWDENFQKVNFKFSSDRLGKISHQQILQIDEFRMFLEEDCKKIENADKICWNITGGQRPYILAVYDLIKNMKDKTHYLLYLEGNSKKISITKFESGEIKPSFDGNCNEDYAIEGLTIDIALELMGYSTNGKDNLENILENPTKIQKLTDFYSNFYDAYSSDENLRNLMPEFNINYKDFKGIIKKFPQIANLTGDDIETEWKNYAKGKTFGYILEDMLLYLLLKSIKDNKLEKYVAGVYPSTKISAGYMETNETVDEFDTLILTKTGQIISFEAKSGSMSADVAKSTNYSTYAISGVYGLPILITPRVKTEDNLDTKNGNISKAIGAAKRANLETWYLDKVVEKLKDKLSK
jgi:hypothetical protein